MKASTAIAIALVLCALIGAQVYYSTVYSKQPAPSAATEDTGSDAAPEAPAAPEPPRPDAVTTIILSAADGGNPVWLERSGTDWRVETLYGVPADNAVVHRFLTALLAESQPVDGTDDSGTDPDEGILVSLGLDGGEAEPYLILGVRPPSTCRAVYARLLDTDSVVVIPADLRGDMGLYKNEPGQLPGNEPWIQTRVAGFDPLDVVSLMVEYPDHRLAFTRTEGGDWDLDGTPPGGEWHRDGLADWLRDLADFRITDVGDPANRAMYGLDAPSHVMEVRLADGSVTTITAAPNRMGEGMWVATSGLPDQVFYLPAWRFQYYFQRMGDLFPMASPKYLPEAIRFIDIRRGGESVKLTNRNGEWSAVATRYPLRKDRIHRLASVLAGWRPDDYADAGARQARPLFGGPLVEVTLESGAVHQYRLGGRHPVFPWRYVLVDGQAMLATADADAMSMFPEFSEIMDLGMVFGDFVPEQITRLELSAMDHAEPLLSAGLTADGDWEAVTALGTTTLEPAEVDGLIRAPFGWKVAGFYQIDAKDEAENMLLLHIAGGGLDRRIVILAPQGRDVPYVNEKDETFLVDRTAFFTWLGILRGINARLEAEAEARRQAEEAEAIRALEAAEAEALSQALQEEERAAAAAADPVTDDSDMPPLLYDEAEEPQTAPDHPVDDAVESVEAEDVEQAEQPDEPAEPALLDDDSASEPPPEEVVAPDSEDEPMAADPEPAVVEDEESPEPLEAVNDAPAAEEQPVDAEEPAGDELDAEQPPAA